MKRIVERIGMTVVMFVFALGFGVCGSSATTAKAADVEITEDNFGTDERLLAYIHGLDLDNDGILSEGEAAKVGNMYFDNATNDISKVIAYFPNLSYVHVNVGGYDSLNINNHAIKTLNINAQKVIDLKGAGSVNKIIYTMKEKTGKVDFSEAKGYSKIKNFYFYGYGSKVTDVVAPNEKNLTYLGIVGTKMKKMEASRYQKVKTLDLTSNQLTSINVTKNKTLVSLACYNNKLTSLNISSNKELKDIGAGDNKLTKLDTTKNQKLLRVVAYDNNIKSYPAASNKKLTEINFSCNKLTNLNVTQNKNLQMLDVSGNKLTKIDVTKNKNLNLLHIGGNKIKNITLSENKKLGSLSVGGNSIKKLSLPKSVALNYISVGSSYNLLKDIKLKPIGYVRICMKLAANKTYQLKSLIPALKGYTFEGSSDIAVDKSGKLKMPKVSEDQYAMILAKDGEQYVYISLNDKGYR